MNAPTSKDLAPPGPDAVPLTVVLFGPMQVLVQGHLLPPLRSRKALWLLALLVLRHGRPVEREWLAATLWPDADPEQSLSSLRSVLLDLRAALGSEAVRLLSPSRRVLALELRGAAVDVLAFDEAAAAKSLPALAQAVSLYRGPLLEGCAEEWVEQERTVREQNCLQALLVLAEASLAEKDWAAAADYARRAVALDPWRDGARRSLMEALAGGGDGNAALLIYREFVSLLRDDPRAAPDRETSALYGQLRAQARQAGHTRDLGAVTESPADAPPAVSGYLPHALTNLIGREDEREDVAALLRRSRLVTLTGPGGIGKTRLAVAVAREVAGEYPDGVWLVPLEALPAGGQVASQLAAVLGVKEKPGQSALGSVVSHLREKRLLVVLDNCEHLLETTAQAAGHLLLECAGVRVLATSREPLAVTGEMVWPVPGLAVPDPAHLPAGGPTLVRVLASYEGIQLFVERVQAVQQIFALTAVTAPAVAQICARLGGIPLALELAAARVRAMTVMQMTQRLNDHLGLLTDGSRIAPSRQRTLRATLDWSYALLSVLEQLLLARVSVFAGGWTLEAAEAVCAGDGVEPGQVIDLLTSLVDKSLVMFEAQQAAGTGSGRYRLLEMVRQYAAERLAAGGTAKSVQARHQVWFLALAEEAEPQLRGPAQAAWLARLEMEDDNLVVALSGSEEGGLRAEAGLRLAGAVWWFWNQRGRYGEGRRYLEEALASVPGRTVLQAKALNAAGALAHNQADNTAAQRLHEASLAIFEEHGDWRGVASACNNLGNVARSFGDYTAALSFWEKSLSASREVDDRTGCATVLHNLGGLVRQQGNYAAAVELLTESLTIRRSLGDQRGIAHSLGSLGNVTRLQGNNARARDLLEESVILCRELGDRTSIAYALSHLGAVETALEHYSAATALFEESLSIRRGLGEKPSIAWSLDNLGIAALFEGRLPAARALFEESLNLFRELRDRGGTAWTLNYLGDVAGRSGEEKAASALFAESLALFCELKDREGVAENLRDLGGACVAKPERATYLWGAAESLRESIGVPLSQAEQRTHSLEVGRVQMELGDEVFTAAWGEGRAWTWEQAAEYALKE